MSSTQSVRNVWWRKSWIGLIAAGLFFGSVPRARADDNDRGENHDGQDIHVRVPGIFELNIGKNQPPPPPQATAPFTVLTQGPVNEAFAEPILFNPAPSTPVPQPPPAPLDEVPPSLAPQEQDVVWIPGYWAWSNQQNGYIWVSGIWRNVPPDREFVPGYWVSSRDGYRWVPGFWQSDQQQSVIYLPKPPQSLESGPQGNPPQPNSVWIPGTWLWQDNNYVWRAGFWATGYPDWVWVPDHYVWAPAGYIFVNGYWDYPLDQRGVLFAPVQVAQSVAQPQTVVYQPSVVLSAAQLMNDWFVRPQNWTYYFGDYYTKRDFQAGIYPAYSFYQSNYGYDPIFAHYLARRQDRREQILQDMRRDYHLLRDHPDLRPPRTYAALEQLRGRQGLNPRLQQQLGMAWPLAQWSQKQQTEHHPIRLERVQPNREQRYREIIGETRKYQNRRRELETQAPSPSEHPGRVSIPSPRIPEEAPQVKPGAPTEKQSAEKPSLPQQKTPPKPGHEREHLQRTTPEITRPPAPPPESKRPGAPAGPSVQPKPGEPRQALPQHETPREQHTLGYRSPQPGEKPPGSAVQKQAGERRPTERGAAPRTMQAQRSPLKTQRAAGQHKAKAEPPKPQPERGKTEKRNADKVGVHGRDQSGAALHSPAIKPEEQQRPPRAPKE